MQTDNRVWDGMARFFTNAASAAQAFRGEMETMMKGRFERLAAELDFVPRAEFDAVKTMAAKARAETQKLAVRIAALEAKLGAAKPPARERRLSPPANPRKRKAKQGRGKL